MRQAEIEHMRRSGNRGTAALGDTSNASCPGAERGTVVMRQPTVVMPCFVSLALAVGFAAACAPVKSELAVSRTEPARSESAAARCEDERQPEEDLEAAFATTGGDVKEWLETPEGPQQRPSRWGDDEVVSLCYYASTYAPSVPAGVKTKFTRRAAVVGTTSSPADATLFIGPSTGPPDAPPRAVRIQGR